MPRKPKAKNQVPVDGPVPDVGNMQMWKAIAQQTIGETDGWPVMEVATALQECAQLIGRKWKKINQIIEASSEKCGQFSFQVTIDRAETPPEVSTKISITQNFNDRITSKTPDPTQSELPLAAGETEAEVA